MPDHKPVSLTPFFTHLDSKEFKAICDWPFADAYISRLLREDIPRRVKFGNCRIWVYRDPDMQFAGFGTLDICNECGEYTDGRSHPYIPLLAINPTVTSLGYGTGILSHLVDEAAMWIHAGTGFFPVLFLDVYLANERAIKLYKKCGFQQVSPNPIPDRQECDRPYIIMARRVQIG